MSHQATWTATHNVTFSQGVADGLTHYDWLDGRKIDPAGRDRALASHSVLPERVEGLTTNDIYGPLFGGSSPSSGLQHALANRLRVRMAAFGSPEYALTWRQWDIGLGEPICALRASGHRASGSGYGGWQTPKLPSGGACQRNSAGGGLRKLEDQVELQLAGWPTASVRDYKDTPGMATTGINPDGSVRKRLDQLPRVAVLTGPAQSGGHAEMESLAAYLPDGWTIPDNGRLNPAFSLWLMGYPAAFLWCAPHSAAVPRTKKKPDRPTG